MSLVTLANIHHAFGNHIVLDGVTLSIEPGEKIGLVGRNGCGKTTLMKVIQGNLSPDSGAVQLQRSARVGYLSQDPEFQPGDTLRDAAERAFAKLHELHIKLKVVFDEMQHETGAGLDRLLKRQVTLESQIQTAGGYAIDHIIDATLHGLGFVDEQFSLPTDVLSGGQKSRLALAKLLLESPDLLLLDEPTNHLDIVGRQWLETFLADEYRGAVLLVSHDRWLLDRVVKKIVLVDNGLVLEYPGNYSKFVQLRQQQRVTEVRTYEKQLDKIRQEEQFIRRYKAGQRSKQAKGRESRLDRYKRDQLLDRPIELDVMKLELPKAPRSGDQIVVAEGISKRYGETVLFENFDIAIMSGDRIGIIGPNGVGKTTLIQCFLGDLELDEGKISLGTRLSIGYYRQLTEHLDMELTVWQYIQSVICALDGQARASEQQARNLAGAFLFSGDEQDKVLGDLSGGERSRAVLAGLMASAKNVLVLDEPTNHLDIPSAERIENVLRLGGDYQGTLLLVSHDRALLEATCDKLIVFDDGKVALVHGTYSQWMSRKLKADREVKTKNNRPARSKVKKRASQQGSAASKSGLQALSMKKLEHSIEKIENRICEIDAEVVDPKVYRDGELCKALQLEREGLVDKLEDVEKEWARRAEKA
ncbi:MAG: ABC-F family ATP-binding cassette domain-containing protein [Planctomycetes bacterium]|nr:ABC-F family ATP-binding cassette domain-containing protein [Planctomycetota bacterium]